MTIKIKTNFFNAVQALLNGNVDRAIEHLVVEAQEKGLSQVIKNWETISSVQAGIDQEESLLVKELTTQACAFSADLGREQSHPYRAALGIN